MTTSEPLLPLDWKPTVCPDPGACLDPLRVRTHRRSIRKVRASTAIKRDSSSTPFDWELSSDPLSSALRTSIAFDIAELTGSAPHWSVSATSQGRLLWELALSAPSTSASASGSWQPTPRAHKGGLPDSHGKRLAIPLPDGSSSDDLKTAASAWNTSGRKLLAAVYELMMGYPIGWLSGPEKPTATPSFLSSPSSSFEP